MSPIKIIRRIFEYFNLESELDDFETIHESIVKDTVFKGTNLWILIFAIIVASVGLNMNSTAVIIGAMLISPLMGPINGMGYSIATYDFVLFRQSIKNFTFAVATSLVASTIYFAISPVSTAHSELLARTTPTIYDVLIAMFGGLAGIVAIASKKKGNVIPGVAIATALMPPLCTAGYGLATGQFNFFFGAFYLFTINTVFIALASVAISQILKFPIRTIVDANQKNKVNRTISFIIALVLLPSIYFGYGLVVKEKFTENANKYVLNVSAFEGNYLLKSNVNPDKREIELIYGGISLNAGQKEVIRLKSENFNLEDAKIKISQGLSFDDFNEKKSEMIVLKEELNKLNTSLKIKELQLDSVTKKGQEGKRILTEINSIYPQIVGCFIAEAYEFTDTLKTPTLISVVLFKTINNIQDKDKLKIENWVKTRLKADKIEVIYKFKEE
jgi:uncharacterized hydrophobic protein (TIGR00271 family)